jgi:Ohr subfamily peroxiredoxin
MPGLPGEILRFHHRLNFNLTRRTTTTQIDNDVRNLYTPIFPAGASNPPAEEFEHQAMAPSKPLPSAPIHPSQGPNTYSQGGLTMTPEKVVYTAKDHTTGGRDGGHARTSDGRLDVNFSIPGKPGAGTNPEQLLAAGWSACFLSAMGIVASKMHVTLPPETAIDAEIDLCQSGVDFFLKARLNVSLPGLSRDVAEALIHAAHENCPYSKATRGNIDVQVNLAEPQAAAQTA